ncbi:MAG: PKD domain-containing protein [Planctomycetes bacterium]|nr:PKD domain-containing protein [Planctomycetota bacterium]
MRRSALSIVVSTFAVLGSFAFAGEPEQPVAGSVPPSSPLAATFAPVPGVREWTARLIVRPVQASAWVAKGATRADGWARRAAARKELQRFELVRYVPETDESVIRIAAPGLEPRVAAELLATGNFEYVEPDWLLSPSVLSQSSQAPLGGGVGIAPSRQPLPNCPDDLYFASQWHHQPWATNSCLAWSLETGDPSIQVGVCDTGVRTTHEDLKLHRLEGYNAVDRLWETQGGQIEPVHHHGTRTTGVVAANGGNGLGVSGVGWNLSHRMLRVSNLSTGGAYLSDLQHAARTSIESGDRIANVSYAGVGYTSNLTTASYVKTIGGLLVWAAGNEGGVPAYTDRDADDLIVVGASDLSDGLAYFSNYGPYVDLVAPGVNIFTTDYFANDAYTGSPLGTSFAAPIVSGVCALIWSRRPTLSPNDVELLLKAGADDLGVPGVDDSFGYGRADAFESLMLSGTTVPNAELAAYPTSGLSPLVVRFRDLSTGVPSAWTWDFGDGTTSTEQNPTHTYAALGSYTVTLGVTNALGSDATTVTDCVLVDVVPPIADFTASTHGGTSPLTVQFTDLSAGGAPTAWAWSFGDGQTSTLQHPSHVYTTSGYFSVTLTASNAYGSDTSTQTNCVIVDFIPPIASFSGQPTSGNAPFVVDFTDESTGGAPTSWYWNFGDGGAAVVPDPSHTYTTPGTYSVRLTATNVYGSTFLDRVAYIQVGQGPPIVADFVASPTTGSGPLTVQFTDLSVGNVIAWEWDFGDDTTSTAQNPTHTFTSPGEYDVSLQVTDPNGKDAQLDKLKYVIVN